MTRLDPVHPGEILKHDFMEPFALSATALANAIGVDSTHIDDIVDLRRGITAETALRLARYFNTGSADTRSRRLTWLDDFDRPIVAVSKSPSCWTSRSSTTPSSSTG